MRGVLAGCVGLAGLIYSGRIWIRIFSRFGSEIDLPDRVFLIPVLGYLAATVSAGALLTQVPWAPDLMALALIGGRWRPKRLGQDGMDRDAIEQARVARSL